MNRPEAAAAGGRLDREDTKVKLRLVSTALVFVALPIVGACQEAENYSISDLEEHGFTRDQQQIFQMVGAIDGWAGTWNGDVVEVYVYTDETFKVPEMLQNAAQPGNVSGWAEVCRRANILMLSKGDSACPELDALDPL